MRICVWEKRREKGLTLEELAKLSEISKSTLNRIENGQTSPRLDQLEQIAKALKVKITDLFESDML